MRTATTSVLIAACILSLYGCEKKPRHHYIQPELWEMVNFNHSTYWIMKDSVSGELDSFHVMSSTGRVSSLSSDEKDYYEHADCNINEYKNDTVFNRWFLYCSGGGAAIGFSDANMFGQFHEYAVIASSPFIKSHVHITEGASQTANGELLAQMVINGSVYDSVQHYHYSSAHNEWDDDVYFNKKYGFLKIVQKNSYSLPRTLLLERSLIIRRP